MKHAKNCSMACRSAPEMFIYTDRQFRSAHAQNTPTIQSCPSCILSKDSLLDKTMAYTCAVNNCSYGSYWLKNWGKTVSKCGCLHKDRECSCNPPFRQIFRYILWNRCTSYRDESGWVKSSLQSFALFVYQLKLPTKMSTQIVHVASCSSICTGWLFWNQ